MDRNPVSVLSLLGLLILACLSGYFLGRIVSIESSLPSVQTTVKTIDRGIVPTVSVDALENSEWKGSIVGDARLILGGVPVLLDGSGAFRVAAQGLLLNRVTVNVPEGMKYVASRRGKKYYPVGSRDAETLVPENRLYFRTAEEAEGAGFVR